MFPYKTYSIFYFNLLIIYRLVLDKRNILNSYIKQYLYRLGTYFFNSALLKLIFFKVL